MSLSSSASDIFVACGFFAPAPRRVARVINLTLFISAPASSTSQSAAASSGPIQLYTNPLPLRRWSWPTCHASGSEQSKHERPETWVTLCTGHMGNTFRPLAGGVDAVEGVFGRGRAFAVCRPASRWRADGGGVPELRHLT